MYLCFFTFIFNLFITVQLHKVWSSLFKFSNIIINIIIALGGFTFKFNRFHRALGVLVYYVLLNIAIVDLFQTAVIAIISAVCMKAS